MEDEYNLTKEKLNIVLIWWLHCICNLLVGVGAAWKVADVEKGSTVAIFGLGAVGLAVILPAPFLWQYTVTFAVLQITHASYVFFILPFHYLSSRCYKIEKF
jgi:Zn-dependent alcohol dehydrogenase